MKMMKSNGLKPGLSSGGFILLLLLGCFCLYGCSSSGATVKTYHIDTNKDGTADMHLSAEIMATHIEKAKADLIAAGKAVTPESVLASIDLNDDGEADDIGATEEVSGGLEGTINTVIGWLPAPFNNTGSLIMTAANLGLLWFRRRDKVALNGVAEEIKRDGSATLMGRIKARALPALNKAVKKMNARDAGKPTNILSSILSTVLDNSAGILSSVSKMTTGRRKK